MTNIKTTKQYQAARASSMAAGFRKRLSSLTTVLLDGTTPTPADVIDTLEGYAKLYEDVVHAKAAYEAAVARADEQEAAQTAYLGACQRFVRASFGNDPVVLEDFGVDPVKVRTPLTVAEKAAAVAKRESTREARGVRGSKQRLAIHGDVTGVSITPVTEPSATQPAAKPAAEVPTQAK